jgi:hypothetical protein
MQSKIMMRATAIGAVCALAGAGAGIAGSSAASSTSTSAKSAKTAKSTAARRAAGFRGMGGPGHDHAVHAVETVLNRAGTAYITETEDNGTVKSVSGDEVTITEGTTAVPYKDVTVTIPSGATVERNGKTATVADLKAGDDIHVSVSSDGTDVHAHDASFTPARGGHGGPGGPPPAAATTTK